MWEDEQRSVTPPKAVASDMRPGMTFKKWLYQKIIQQHEFRFPYPLPFWSCTLNLILLTFLTSHSLPSTSLFLNPLLIVSLFLMAYRSHSYSNFLYLLLYPSPSPLLFAYLICSSISCILVVPTSRIHLPPVLHFWAYFWFLDSSWT